MEVWIGEIDTKKYYSYFIRPRALL